MIESNSLSNFFYFVLNNGCVLYLFSIILSNKLISEIILFRQGKYISRSFRIRTYEARMFLILPITMMTTDYRPKQFQTVKKNTRDIFDTLLLFQSCTFEFHMHKTDAGWSYHWLEFKLLHQIHRINLHGQMCSETY